MLFLIWGNPQNLLARLSFKLDTYEARREDSLLAVQMFPSWCLLCFVSVSSYRATSGPIFNEERDSTQMFVIKISALTRKEGQMERQIYQSTSYMSPDD